MEGYESTEGEPANKAAPASPPPQPPGPPTGHGGKGLDQRGPRAAIIIDDLGNSRRHASVVSELSYPVAVAVLPQTPHAAQTARQAHASGKEVLLHMPMEPGDSGVRLDGSFLRAGMGREHLLATLRSNLAGIPHVQGVNNHMGSRLTARSRPMRWVMEALDRRGLYFIDSRTTAATKGLKEARAAGLPAAERDVFLDHDPAEEAVREQFRTMLTQAREQGTALAIAHPHPVTLKVLREMLPQASRRGVEIVPLREVVAVRSGQAAKGGSLAYKGSDN
ncbi:divergent polysaccharide deacetylase family protein [Thiohalorhabdus sp.]|uniref:divergent polysaccharide deacetylase family protein n=1 Tax=Thiohalorhabdus sp. TaxID=3094134 RepID=UPI002FC2C21D